MSVSRTSRFRGSHHFVDPIVIRTTRCNSSGEGRGSWTVNGEEFEAGTGDILVIKPGAVHSFHCIGEAPLVQLDLHLSPRFIQENLAPGA